MKKSNLIIVILLVWGCAVAAAVAESDPDLPHAPLSRLDFVTAKSLIGSDKNGEMGDAAATSDRYDMLRVALDLRIDPTDKTIAGTVKMVFRSEHAGLDQFVFDLIANLDVDSIVHSSGPLAFSHLADSVSVTLPAPLAPGTVDSFVVAYSGIPSMPFYNRGLMFKTHFPVPELDQSSLVPIIASMSQPAYAQSWWPCKDRPDDKFRMRMSLTVPDTLVAVSNGTLLGEEAADAGWKTFHWSEDYPIASYLVSVAISDYLRLESECLTTGGTQVPLRNWVFPAYEANAIVDFAPLCDMLEFCESRFGPYPFAGEKYGHAQFIWPGAMEHQTVTSIGSGSLNGDGSRDWLVVHELGHQWFGDSLTPADWADVWLNEGFATYAEALWFEHSEGVDAYQAYMDNARNDGEWQSQGPVYDPVPIFPGRVIYDKGAWILHMLRFRMGDTAFFQFLSAWTDGADRSLGYVQTQELIDLAGGLAGEDLNDFLWPYLRTTAIPLVDFDYAVSSGSGGPDTHLQVSLSQIQAEIFDNKYPIVVTTETGQTTEWVNLRTVATVAEFDYDAPILQVAFDPDEVVLWQPAGSASANQGIKLAFPNPSSGNYVVFRYWLSQTAALQLRIFDVMGREVFARDLGLDDDGLHEWGWDVSGNDGERIPSGVYWAAMYVNGVRSVVKFSIVR